MAVTTTSNLLSSFPFVASPDGLMRHPGRTIDWAGVPTTYIPTGGLRKQLRAGLAVGVRNNRWLPCAVSFSVSALVVASNVATATSAAHGFVVGDVVTIAGSNLSYANGSVTILTVADANTFTYTATGSNATATGTITARVSARGLLATPAQDGGPDALTGHGVIIAGDVYENLLPDATGTPVVLPAAYKTELNTTGVCGPFRFYTYSDSAAS